jgi:hypothetical protein
MGLGRGFFPANKCVRLNLVNPKGTIVFFMGQNLNAKMYSSWNIGYLRINSQKKVFKNNRSYQRNIWSTHLWICFYNELMNL